MSEFDELLDSVLSEGEDPRPAATSPSVSTEEGARKSSERAGGVCSSSGSGAAVPEASSELEPEGSVGQSADVTGPEAPGDAIGKSGQEVGLTARSEEYEFFKPDPKPSWKKKRKESHGR